MDLALALGLANPDDVELLPNRVYEEWFQYFNDGPLFWRLLDQHFARLQAILVNAYRDPKRTPERKTSDFQVYGSLYRRPKPSGEELLNRLIHINRLLGGEFIDKRKQRDDG